MERLRFTLVADGPSDRALLPVLTWLLRQHCEGVSIQPEFSDLRWLPNPPQGLFRRIDKSMELYPCDLLFVHRDAEGESVEKRQDEIRAALERSERGKTLPVVCVVPVRMQEAWLLIDESALKRAAGNPENRQRLSMPPVKRLEDLPDPKRVLHDLLREASDCRGPRRLKNFNRDLGKCVQLVAEHIGDFGLLRGLTAFRELENQVIGHREHITMRAHEKRLPAGAARA